MQDLSNVVAAKASISRYGQIECMTQVLSSSRTILPIPTIDSWLLLCCVVVALKLLSWRQVLLSWDGRKDHIRAGLKQPSTLVNIHLRKTEALFHFNGPVHSGKITFFYSKTDAIQSVPVDVFFSFNKETLMLFWHLPYQKNNLSLIKCIWNVSCFVLMKAWDEEKIREILVNSTWALHLENAEKALEKQQETGFSDESELWSWKSTLNHT